MRPPRYPSRAHKSGQARIKIHGETIYLGKFGSPESHARYEEELRRWRAIQRGEEPTAQSGLTVREVVAAFLGHIKRRYRKPDGTPKKELEQFPLALGPVLLLYARLPVRDFRKRQLLRVQEEMVRRGWCRRVCNRHLVRVRTMFRWAEVEELVPEGTWATLRTVKGLGRGQAPEHEAVAPVPEQDLAATLPQLGRVVRAAVEIQLLTGGRPSEVLGLRPMDLQRKGKVWTAELGEHKTAHLGHGRCLLIGPRAQKILKPFLDRPADVYLFSPREAAEDALKAIEARRGKPVSRRQRRSRSPGARYRTDSYGHAIRAACDRAKVSPWSAYRLRHNAATRLVEQFGWDVARIVLGHRTVSMTRQYAQDDLKKAIDAMVKAG